jgi:HSP20 family molecular chaperone IbpA
MLDRNEKKLTRRDGRAPEAVKARPAAAPAVDIYENPDELLLVADVPGVAPDGLTVRLEDDELLIEGRREDAETDAPAGRRARPDWTRAFLVPQGIDGAKISAEIALGVLTVRLPKREALKPRRIEVRAG